MFTFRAQTEVREASMSGIAARLRSSIGRKLLVALTGLLLIGFLLGHLAGNLLVYQGQDAVNNYALWLKSKPLLLWGARIGLLLVFIVHLRLAVLLRLENRRARPVPYEYESTVQASFASRSMLLSGLVVLAYLVYHLLHLTFGSILPDNFALRDAQGRHDVYSMLVRGLRNPFVAASYVLAMLLLGLHLMHAITSVFQTLGFGHPRYERIVRFIGPGLAGLIVLLYCTIPLSIYLGLVLLPGEK